MSERISAPTIDSERQYTYSCIGQPYPKQILTEGLAVLIAELLANPADGLTVIQAGHYHLSWQNGFACDALEESSELNIAKQQLAKLAKKTWRASCKAIQLMDPKNEVRLMALVNDWQLLQPPIKSRRKREAEAARLRTEYYLRTPTLPAKYLEILEASSINSGSILKQSNACWLFSEQRLRYEFNKTITKALAGQQETGTLNLYRESTAHNEPVVYGLTCDGQKHCVLHSGNTNCAGEVVQLLYKLQNHGVKRFINLYPAECRQPVGVGTVLAQQMFRLKNMSVTNIAITPLNGECVRIFEDKL